MNSNYFIFDIPSSCKIYFEKKIRSLGIDESFYGDIDGIAKNITYQGKNSQLYSVSKPKEKDVYALWTHKLSDLIQNFFIEKGSILLIDSDYVVCDEYINCKVIHIADSKFHYKNAIAHLSVIIEPNSKRIENLLFVDASKNKPNENYIHFARGCNIDLANLRFHTSYIY